jgi:hypothetical protein
MQSTQDAPTSRYVPWNKGKLTGRKPPLQLATLVVVTVNDAPVVPSMRFTRPIAEQGILRREQGKLSR